MSAGEKRTSRRLIACESLRPELEHVIREAGSGVQAEYLDQNLHRHPRRIRAELEKRLSDSSGDGNGSGCETVLGYGLCSGGVLGLEARGTRLIVPRVHDCIGLYLGGPGRYEAVFWESPGTYYLTPGWLDVGKDPLTTMRDEYASRVGKEAAEETMRIELRHYSRLMLIDTGVRRDIEGLREQAQENARYFDLEYVEVAGDLGLFRRMVLGPYHPSEFVVVEPGERIVRDEFLRKGGAARPGSCRDSCMGGEAGLHSGTPQR